MPKSSRHKSHRQSKHSSKGAKEYSESDEDTKMREYVKEESSVTVSKNLDPREKRKDPPNGGVAEEYVGSKRRREKEKEKEKGDVSAVSDRWIGGGVGESLKTDGEKTLKLKSGADSKSKSSKDRDSVGEKKEESKSGSKAESKRKHEKESGRKEAQMGKDSKESKDKIKAVEKDKEKDKEKERKAKESIVEVEDEVVDIEDDIIPPVVFVEGKKGKHGREINVWPIQDERVLESEKEIENRRKKRDVLCEKDKYLVDVKGSEDRQVSSRGERTKDDGKYKEEKYKDGSYGDKHREDVEREARYKDGKYAEDVDREKRYRDAKYRESCEKFNRHKDDKYREDVERDKRPRDDKYVDDVKVSEDRRVSSRGERAKDDSKYKEEKYKDGSYGDKHREDGKYRESDDRDTKYRDANYREDADKDYRRRVDKYHEDGNRDDRQRDDWCFEDYTRDSRIREEKQRDDIGKDKRLRDTKYQDERLVRDGTNDNSDPKRSRDESQVADFRPKRLGNRDGSPNFDDRNTRYKDDRGKRRASDKEEYDDVRPRSNKEQYIDLEKKTTSARVESVGNRGRSSLRDADMVITPNHVRRGDSPSYRPSCRLLKQEESRYREYTHGGRERGRRDVTPGKEYAGIFGVTEKVSSLNEKSFLKDDGKSDDASTQRRSKEDGPISPFQMVDKSPSSAGNDRRNLRRDDSRRSLDIEDSGQRTSGSKEIKEYYGRDNRGNRELPIENLPRDEISQPDTENLSAASPFTRPSHFNNNNRSLPPTPFRGVPDRPFDDDNRNKLNRRRRMDPNMGRAQGNAWRSVPNWPSPVANGFVPFQHGPPPLGFHPVMPQFPTPPMFNVRPSIEMNQSGLPFHLDGDRFPRHNPIFGDDPHIYGRLDWDHTRGLSRGWETSRDIWKGQNTGVSADFSVMSQKDEFSAHGPGDDKNQTSVQAESVETDELRDVVVKDVAESPKAIEEDMIESKIRDDAYFSRAYLSMLDISEDLSQYEVYSQYTNLVGEHQNANPEEDDSKILIMEEDIDALGKDSKKTSNASLFCAMNDAIFQSAMSMYKKLKEEAMTMGQDKVPFPAPENTESALPSASNDEQLPMKVIPTLRQQEAEVATSDSIKVKLEEFFLTDVGVKTEPIATLSVVKMEIADNNVEDKSLPLKEMTMDSTDDNSDEGHNLKDGKFDLLPFSGASAEVGNEVVIESGSVNLSRIHQSRKSTH